MGHPAVAAAIAACLPIIIIGSGQAGSQIGWILRPGLDLTAFSSFGQSLCYSTPVAVVLLIALLGASDQGVIREPGAHNWASYPVSPDRGYWDYANAASLIARTGVGGRDTGIVFPIVPGEYLMIDAGVRYYLGQDGAVVPRQLFIAATAQQADALYAVACEHPAACLGSEDRIWIVSAGHETDAWTAVPPGEAASLRARYHSVLTRHTEGLSIFLLQRDAGA